MRSSVGTSRGVPDRFRGHPTIGKLSALLCIALLTSVSGVAAQAAPGTPDESTQAPADGTTQAPAAPTTEGEAAPAEITPAAPSTQTSDEESAAPAAEAAPVEAAPAAEPVAAPAPAPVTAEKSANFTLQTTTLPGADADEKSDKEKEEEALKKVTCGSGSLALSSGGCTKNWRVIGYAEYRKLAVGDADPKNDQSFRAFVQGSYRVVHKYNIQVWARLRYLQPFVGVEGEKAARFQDPVLGLDYMQQMDLGEKGWKGANLTFQHRVTGTIPAQKESRDDDLYTKITGLERVRLSPISTFYVGPDLVADYNFYKYAEQPGQQGGVFPQADFSGTLVAEYYPWESEKYGSVLVGVDGGLMYTVLYKGRGGDVAQDANRWRQWYSWDVYAYYMPRPWLWLGVDMSHSMLALRDGVVNPDVFNRDATLLSFSMTALY
jgi:hypothetical protein